MICKIVRIKSMESLVNSFEYKFTEKRIESMMNFMNKMESIQFQCLKTLIRAFSSLGNHLKEENRRLFEEKFNKAFIECGKSMKKENNAVNKDFLSTIRNNFAFFEEVGLLVEKKMIKILCGFINSENKDERSLVAEILLNLSKNKAASKIMSEKLNTKEVYTALQEKDKVGVLKEFMIKILLNLSPHKKSLQEKIMEYPPILRIFVQYLEKAIRNADENKDFLINLCQLLTTLVEYYPIK